MKKNIEIELLDVITYGNFRIEAQFVDGEPCLRILSEKGNISVHPRQHNSITIKNPKQ